jgi:hypothetical protein
MRIDLDILPTSWAIFNLIAKIGGQLSTLLFLFKLLYLVKDIYIYARFHKYPVNWDLFRMTFPCAPQKHIFWMLEEEKRIEKDFMSGRPPMAYAKLQGFVNEDEAFEVVITHLPVELGRGCVTNPTMNNNKIALGEQMSVSRQHAKIDWNSKKACFELQCLGKNGLYAAGRWIL